MDDIDKRILTMMQDEFPLSETPFADIGRSLGIAGRDVEERVLRMKDAGYVRRIGPVLDATEMGRVSLLCGAAVPGDVLEAFAAAVNAEPAVTHNYEREGELNVWFTVTMKAMDDIDMFLTGLESAYAVRIYRFPRKRTFKIKTRFALP